MDPRNIPQHVAIIMDGNGRWATQRHLPRTQGHIEGVKRVEEVIASARMLGLKVLTLFTFSTENWNRPSHEVTMLMEMLITVINMNIQKLKEDNIRFRFIGRREGIPEKVLKTMDTAVNETAGSNGLILNLAFNYGGRLEILDAVKAIALDVRDQKLKPEEIDERIFSRALYTRDLPDPDLLIRTSGEKRVSNFLLWQLSYAEFYFTDKFWPEFDVHELKRAVEDFQSRERRFGNVGEIK